MILVDPSMPFRPTPRVERCAFGGWTAMVHVRFRDRTERLFRIGEFHTEAMAHEEAVIAVEHTKRQGVNYLVRSYS